MSSAHEDEQLHGQGFVARLSGSTAEFLHIWLLMNVGPQPFSLDGNKRLTLQFNPALKGSLFTGKKTTAEFVDRHAVHHKMELPANTYAFNFLASTVVVYHNPKRQDTFGPKKPGVREIRLTYATDNRPEVLTSAVIPSPFAEDIRDRKVSRIDVSFE